MNSAIAAALAARLGRDTERPGWIADMLPSLEEARNAGGFPPDYQAQIIEEMCGDRYFRALQSLDVDVINTAHDGIAALAEVGGLRAVVTTNFDRLIERALDARAVEYRLAFNDEGFRTMADALQRHDRTWLPVIKIHGSVADHLSMIDTLKQRKRGRSDALRNCLDSLGACHWLYAGFSAADLEADPLYLGLVQRAKSSNGGTYILFPGTNLTEGARILVAAHGNSAEVISCQLSDLFNNIAIDRGAASVPSPSDGSVNGT